MGQRVRGETQRGADIIRCQVRIGVEQNRFSRAFGDLPHDQLDGNPRAANDRFAEHHIRTHVDTVVNRHRHRRPMERSQKACPSLRYGYLQFQMRHMAGTGHDEAPYFTDVASPRGFEPRLPP